MELVIREVRVTEPEHASLTYPLYARQLAERLADGDWVVFEARHGEDLVGLIISARYEKRAELLSVAVAKGHRRQGIASRLLGRLLQYCQQEGIEELKVAFRHDLANVDAVKALLVRNGWSEPLECTEIGSLGVRQGVVGLQKYAARFPVSHSAQVISWAETSPEQRAELEVDLENPWYPKNLAPSRFQSPISDHTLSFAILAEGRIIGWILATVELLEPPQVDFCCAYVHPDWQRRGAFMWLLARSAEAILAKHERFVASWTVAEIRPQTRQFVRRRLAPFGARFTPMLTSQAAGLDKSAE